VIPALLVVRCPPWIVDALRRVPGLTDTFRVQTVGQTDADMLRDWPDDGGASDVKELYTALARSCWARHAIVAQPLHWYTEAAADALRLRMAVSVFYLEQLVDRIVLDPIGCQYTADNECKRYARAVPTVALGPRVDVTRFEQTGQWTAATLHAAFGGPGDVVVIYGQCPGDMALEAPGDLSYADFLEAVITRNPQMRFLFKHHPKARTPLRVFDNVREVDASIFSLFAAYPYAVAYSSTVILEGAARGVTFATGGRHLLDGVPGVLQIRGPSGADNLAAQLLAVRSIANREAIARRVAFVERVYTLAPDEPDVLRRILTPFDHSRAYYIERAGRIRRGAA
jgi:hypothetical protein